MDDTKRFIKLPLEIRYHIWGYAKSTTPKIAQCCGCVVTSSACELATNQSEQDSCTQPNAKLCLLSFEYVANIIDPLQVVRLNPKLAYPTTLAFCSKTCMPTALQSATHHQNAIVAGATLRIDMNKSEVEWVQTCGHWIPTYLEVNSIVFAKQYYHDFPVDEDETMEDQKTEAELSGEVRLDIVRQSMFYDLAEVAREFDLSVELGLSFWWCAKDGGSGYAEMTTLSGQKSDVV